MFFIFRDGKRIFEHKIQDLITIREQGEVLGSSGERKCQSLAILNRLKKTLVVNKSKDQLSIIDYGYVFLKDK